jgi:branched-chain amino acid transport system permease protein
MTLELFAISLLNGLSYGLLLFMLSAGLTLIFSMMGVLNFAHASFYMLGAYLACSLAQVIGFWGALLVAPLLVFALGAAFERFCLRRVHAFGHVAELLVTFGLSYLLFEAVQLIWGRQALAYALPPVLQGPLFSLYGAQFPRSRAFIMLVSVAMLAGLWGLLKYSRIGLVIQAALTHPDMAQALGHNVPRIFMGVFGAGAALAALAGVVGGNTFITEPGMAASLGPVIFVVVVVGGLGSLGGAFLASLLIGLMQTFAVALDGSLLTLLAHFKLTVAPGAWGYSLLRLTLAQLAPVLPFLLLVLVLVFRPRGLLGQRDG